MSTTIRAAAAIPLPTEACWEKLRDLTRESDYVPGLVETVITTANKEGVGASRTVTHRHFGDMQETVTEWIDGEAITFRMHKVVGKGSDRIDKPPTPLKSAFFRYALRATPGGTQIETALTYEPLFGLFGRVLDALLLRRLLRRNLIDTTVGLAENYRTDEPIAAPEYARLRANAL
jgi:hypothetical protein